MLAERWNGRTWSIQDMPAPAGVPDPSINGLSCSSSKFCIAVGSSDFGNGGQTFAEHWDGHRWAITSGTDLTAGTIQSISLITNSRNLWAVGTTTDGNFGPFAALYH